jgi:DNA gyrase subunit A
MFLRIEAGTIPEKKKGALGVRGIRLDAEDVLEEVYLFMPGESITVPLKGKNLELNRLRVGNRDTKGVKHS